MFGAVGVFGVVGEHEFHLGVGCEGVEEEGEEGGEEMHGWWGGVRWEGWMGKVQWVVVGWMLMEME